MWKQKKKRRNIQHFTVVFEIMLILKSYAHFKSQLAVSKKNKNKCSSIHWHQWRYFKVKSMQFLALIHFVLAQKKSWNVVYKRTIYYSKPGAKVTLLWLFIEILAAAKSSLLQSWLNSNNYCSWKEFNERLYRKLFRAFFNIVAKSFHELLKIILSKECLSPLLGTLSFS